MSELRDDKNYYDELVHKFNLEKELGLSFSYTKLYILEKMEKEQCSFEYARFVVMRQELQSEVISFRNRMKNDVDYFCDNLIKSICNLNCPAK